MRYMPEFYKFDHLLKVKILFWWNKKCYARAIKLEGELVSVKRMNNKSFWEDVLILELLSNLLLSGKQKLEKQVW